jgi:hypothetical protein
MHHIKSSLFLILSIFLFGCSQKIEGEAFLKKGDAVTPLADIEIRVVELDKFKLHVKNKKAGIESEISKIDSNIKVLQETNEKLIESNAAVMQAWRKALIAKIDAFSSSNSFNIQNKQDALINDAKNSATTSEMAIAKNKQIISTLMKDVDALRQDRNGKFFFYPDDNLEGVVATRTQSNGKFEIVLKSSRESVLLARHNDKYWLLKIGKDDIKINLTDSNENGLSCEVCALK